MIDWTVTFYTPCTEVRYKLVTRYMKLLEYRELVSETHICRGLTPFYGVEGKIMNK